MKRYKIEWSPFALKCVNEIYFYISDKAKSDLPAENFIARLFERVEILETRPYVGQSEPHLEESGIDGRYLVEGDYKIIYRIEEDKISILDVFHTKQNPSKITRRAK